MPASLLGRVVATERRPNTPHEFHFWTALDAPVGIGTIVRVQGKTAVGGVLPQVYGVVVEGFGYTDIATPLHDVLGFDGSPSAASHSTTERAEIRLYTAAVLRQLPEEPLQPVPMGEVFLATDADVEGFLAPPGPGAQHVQALARDDRRQPAAEVLDPGGAGPADPQPRLLDGVLGLGARAQQPVRDRSQPVAVLLEPRGEDVVAGHVVTSLGRRVSEGWETDPDQTRSTS